MAAFSYREQLTSLEICAGGGGEALGLARAGFRHEGLVEIDHAACDTLRLNRPDWAPRVIEDDLRNVDGRQFRGIDLLAGGVPCPPFSVAGKRLGKEDERDLFPAALELVEKARPRAVMLENVPGFASARFEGYRAELFTRLEGLGYRVRAAIVHASYFGVPQYRPRFIIVAIQDKYAASFDWPRWRLQPPTVGEALFDLMAARGWPGTRAWAERASGIAPTIVGGSKKHGGPDLGPTRARRQWAELSVDGLGIADEPPGPDFPVHGMPKLTNRMVARIQGFPDSWEFAGGKTAAYRQIGNALPPAVAYFVGLAIYSALAGAEAVPVPEELPAGAFAVAAGR